jgi:hypothetical protein
MPALPMGWKGFLSADGVLITALCPVCVDVPSAVVNAAQAAASLMARSS